MADKRFKIGNYEGVADRRRPSPDRVNEYLQEMNSDFKNFDVYLWGSWPEKATWDIDLLLKSDKPLSTAEMEDLNIKSLKSSLENHNFLADIGFTYDDPVPFEVAKSRWTDNYMKTATEGYIYGDEWTSDNKIFRDRKKISEGRIEQLDNNIWQKNSFIPYPKLQTAMKNGTYDSYYKGKPALIKKKGSSFTNIMKAYTPNKRIV
jgi:hypothetical protein